MRVGTRGVGGAPTPLPHRVGLRKPEALIAYRAVAITPTPVGVEAISRWLSGATPPAGGCNHLHPNTLRLVAPRPRADPYSRHRLSPAAGGGAALNHRLIAATPAGVESIGDTTSVQGKADPKTHELLEAAPPFGRAHVAARRAPVPGNVVNGATTEDTTIV